MASTRWRLARRVSLYERLAKKRARCREPDRGKQMEREVYTYTQTQSETAAPMPH